jgi:hypothetical protein
MNYILPNQKDAASNLGRFKVTAPVESILSWRMRQCPSRPVGVALARAV